MVDIYISVPSQNINRKKARLDDSASISKMKKDMVDAFCNGERPENYELHILPENINSPVKNSRRMESGDHVLLVRVGDYSGSSLQFIE